MIYGKRASYPFIFKLHNKYIITEIYKIIEIFLHKTPLEPNIIPNSL